MSNNHAHHLTLRLDQMADKKAQRIAGCGVRQEALAAMPGTVKSNCLECGNTYYLHPVFGRSPRCCACRVANIDQLQKRRTPGYQPKPGFPKLNLFVDMLQVDQYFAHEKLTCLLCGHEFKGLQQHINHVHLITADAYKLDFGIPLGRGLVGTATSALIAAATQARVDAMTEDERKHCMDKAIAANPMTGGTASHAPAVTAKRKEIVRQAFESKNHISKTITGTSEAPCSKCGALFEVATWSAVTNPCRIQCRACNLKHRLAYQKKWQAANPEKQLSYGRAYVDRMKASQPEVLKARQKLKNDKKQQVIVAGRLLSEHGVAV